MNLTLHQLLYRAYSGQSSILRPVREEFGLGRGQPRILSYLLEHGGSSQSDIASSTGIDPASVSRMTESLRRGGFLTRCEDDSCRRTNRLELTEKGRMAAEKWRKESRRVENILLAGFSDEETAMFRDFLTRVIGNFSKENSNE